MVVVGGWGGDGSIHQSISNEGKNWSKSSRWKSCSAWGGLSSPPVSRVSDFPHCFVQQRPNWQTTAMATVEVEIQIFTFIAFPAFTAFLSRFPRSTCIPPSLNISYITGSRCTRAWRIMAARPSPLPSFNHPQTASIRQLILHLTHSAGPGSSAVCYYALTLCALHFSHEKRQAYNC